MIMTELSLFSTDRYRKYLEKARHQKTLVSPVIPDHSIKLSCNSYGNMPAMSSQLMSTASHQPGYDRTRLLDANKRGSVEDILNHTNTRHRFNVGLKGIVGSVCNILSHRQLEI